MIIVEKGVAPQRGIGKPDYSREIARGQVRPGFEFKYNQTLLAFLITFSRIASVYSWVKDPLPPDGTHTAGVSATVMTDAAASFIPSAPPLAMGLIGMTIRNVTDGSEGVITANTATTITVAALAGGVTNQWNTNDVYSIVAHLVNGMDDDYLPYSVLAGYTLTMISIGVTCNQDLELWQLLKVYMPPFPPAQRELCLTQLAGGRPFYVPEVVAFSSALFDPTASLAFDYDIQVNNKGGADMEGQIGAYMILEAVGTKPLPPTKTVKCKWCGATKTVPREATNIICDVCGQLTIVYPLQQFKGVS